MTTNYGIDTLIFKILAIAVVFLTPLGSVLTVISILVFLDFCSKMLGFLYCGGVENLKKSFEIKRVIDTTIKMFGYGIILFAVQTVSYSYNIELPLIRIIGSAIALAEVRSIDKNTYEVTGFSVWRIFIEQIKRVIPGMDSVFKDKNKN
jgi:hypothetical protein